MGESRCYRGIMLAEIITFVGIVCAGVLTEEEEGTGLNEGPDRHRFAPHPEPAARDGPPQDPAAGPL